MAIQLLIKGAMTGLTCNPGHVQSMDSTNIIGDCRYGRMLMVIPSNIELRNGEIILDGDFANYLRYYLAAFDEVVVACPAARPRSFPTREPLASLDHEGRLRILVLPEPYREDRYLLNRGKIRRLLSHEIDQADVVVVAPHSPFDWPTLAAHICIKKSKPYNMEGDWNLQQVSWSNWKKLPLGINKLRRFLWMRYHDPLYFEAMRKSTVALLHGRDVFDAYAHIAPNPFSVNNFRVTAEDRISKEALQAKIDRAATGQPLKIVYAGRSIAMKGPLEWLTTLSQLREKGVAFEATWFGEGDMISDMEKFIRDYNLSSVVNIAGRVERSDVFDALFQADIFLFCHLTRESPRNLVEALSAGTPIVGFGSPYSEHLVQGRGGGLFVEAGNIMALVRTLEGLNSNRSDLTQLIMEAASSGEQFERGAAVRRRIELMKRYLQSAD